jgi:hypothetical protein
MENPMRIGPFFGPSDLPLLQEDVTTSKQLNKRSDVDRN